MDLSADLLRNLTLAVPLLLLALVLTLRRARVLPTHRHDVAHAALSALLVWVGVLAVEHTTGLWSFQEGPTTLLGIPLETTLGWAITWGLLPVLAGGRLLLWWAGLAWVDVLVMPRLDPLVVLGPSWWAGELLLLVCVLAPALVLGRAMQVRSHLALRVVLQAVTVVGGCLWLVPTAIFAHSSADWAGSGDWAAVVDHSLPVRTALLMALVLLAVPGLAAVAELARVGRGTPYPWDPPERLVTTGPYAYLANPMQVSATGVLALIACASGSFLLLLAAMAAALLLAAVAGPHEEHTMRDWPGYREYRSAVRAWLPRLRPYVPEQCELWVSQECGTCRATGDAVRRLSPTGLDLLAAEDAPFAMTRMQWVGAGGAGTVDRGVAAMARALEHVGLGWAWFGWLVRLPGVVWVVQTVADACGLGPREVRRRDIQSPPDREQVP